MPSRGRAWELLLWCAWPLPRLVVELLAGAFVGWEGVQGRYSAASHAGILAVIGAALLLAVVSGRGRQRERTGAWARAAALALGEVFAAGRVRTAAVAGALVWALLIAAAIGWDATSFVEQRPTFPTLSRLLGDVTDHVAGRAVLFAAWLVLGVYLAIGRRRPAGGQDTDRRPALQRLGPQPSGSRPAGGVDA